MAVWYRAVVRLHLASVLGVQQVAARDGEAARGKAAVDLNKTNVKWADTVDDAQAKEKPAQTEEELNALSNVKRCFCNKKTHSTSLCQLKKEKGKGNPWGNFDPWMLQLLAAAGEGVQAYGTE